MAVRLSPFLPAALYSQETLFVCSWCSFLLKAESTPGPSAAGRKWKKSDVLYGSQTRDLPACSIVPQPTKLPRDPGWYSHLKWAIVGFFLNIPSRLQFTIVLQFGRLHSDREETLNLIRISGTVLCAAGVSVTILTIVPILVARGSVVGWGTMLQAGRSRVPDPMRSFPAALGSGVYLASNRNK
jgi:hypothetical protein